MNKISVLICTVGISSFFFSTYGQAAERSLCRGDCANSPIPVNQVMDLSAYSNYVTSDQLKKITNDLVVNPPSAKDSEMVTIPVIISNEKFDPKKHAPKLSQPQAFDEAPESAVFLNLTIPTPSHSTATEGRDRVSFETSTSNSMLHQTELQRKDGATRFQKLDGVSRVDQLTIEKGNKDFSITVSYRESALMGHPKSLFAFEECASDDCIENFHDLIGQPDPYNRRKTGMNKAEVDVRDTNGNSLKIKPGKKYVLPLLINFKKFDEIGALSSADGKSKTTLVSGVQAAVPMSSTFSQGGVGAHATLIHNRELRQGLVATFAASMAVNIQKTFGNGYQPFDKETKVSWGGDLSAGLTCLHRNGSSTTATLLLSADSTPLDGKDYRANPGGFLKRQSQAASTEQDYAIGAAVTHRTADGLKVSVGVKEDIGGSQRKSRAIGGNNNRDIQYWATISKEF